MAKRGKDLSTRTYLKTHSGNVHLFDKDDEDNIIRYAPREKINNFADLMNEKNIGPAVSEIYRKRIYD